MKIGFVLPCNGISGGIFVVYRHAHFLKERGHHVEILFTSDAMGLTVQTYPGFDLPVRSLQQAIGESYDVLISTWWETYYDMFSLQAKHYFYFCQSDERRFYSSPFAPEVPFVNFTYQNRGVGIITEARWIQNWLRAQYGVEAEYAPNGIDTALFNPSVAPLEKKGEKIRVLIEGPGSQFFKNINLAFRVANQIPEIEVWHVSSDGVLQPHWKYDRIFQKVPFHEMPPIYASCDILLKLSSVEGFVGPPLEMLACGGTAVVSKATGWEEYLRHEENSLLVDIGSEEQALTALSRLVQDSNLRWRLSKNGIETARQMDWSQQCPLFEKAIFRLVEKGNQAKFSDQDGLFYSTWRKFGELQRSIGGLHGHVGNIHGELSKLHGLLGNLYEQSKMLEQRVALLEDGFFNWRPYRTWKKLRNHLMR